MGYRMRRLLRLRGLHLLIGKIIFLRPTLSVADLNKKNLVSIDLVSGWQRKERFLGRERCYWVLQKWKVNMLGRSYGKK